MNEIEKNTESIKIISDLLFEMNSAFLKVQRDVEQLKIEVEALSHNEMDRTLKMQENQMEFLRIQNLGHYRKLSRLEDELSLLRQHLTDIDNENDLIMEKNKDIKEEHKK